MKVFPFINPLPNPLIKTVHKRQEHPEGLHFFILWMKMSKDSASFISSGIISHVLGPRNRTVSSPLFTVFIFGKIKPFPLHFRLKRSLNGLGQRQFLTLYISMANFCRFRSCIVKDWSFSSNSLKVRDFLSLYTVLNALSCSLLIFLFRCGYPQSIIDKGIHNASIQGPAPLRTNKTIPLITTYFSNYSNKIVVDVTKQLLKNTKNERLQKAFKDVQFVNAHRQPPNLLRQLSHSHFTSAENISLKTPGLFKCNGPHCKLCKFYVHQEKSFTTSNGTIWELKRFANCNSLNVIYFLQCNFCLRETYIGKTGDLRERTNNHISCCRHGSGNNIFDNHVYECAKTNGEQISEERHPFFTLHVMMVISDYDRLLSYESQLHSQRHDTMNRPL